MRFRFKMHARFTNNHFNPNTFDNISIRQQGKMLMWLLLIIPLLSIIWTVTFILSLQAEPPNPDTATAVQIESNTTTNDPIPITPEAPIVGRIENYNGPSSAYLLERQSGKTVAIGFLLSVYEGDKITVNKPGHFLQLAVGSEHQRVEITADNSPYTVEKYGDLLMAWDNSWAWLGNKLSEYHDELCESNKTRCEPDTPVTRNQTYRDTLSIPLLTDNPAYIVAGTRPLYLRWYGGQPPYQVTVSQNGQPLGLLSAENQWIATRALPFKVATIYQVILTDTNGRSITERFTIVPAIDYPNELEESGLSPETRQTVRALWLAAQPQGRWMLEAYQQASEIAERHYPARLLRDQLEKGLWVKP